MPDPWSVVSTKPASNMPPSLATASDPWAVVSHQPAQQNDDLDAMMGNGMPSQEDLNPTAEQHPVVSSALNRAGQLVRGMFSLAKPPETTAEKASLLAGPAGPIVTRLVRGQISAEQQLAPQFQKQMEEARASHAVDSPVTASDFLDNPVDAANRSFNLSDARAANTALAMVNPFASGSVANVNQLQDEGKPQQAAGEGIADALTLATGLPGPSKTINGVVKDSAAAARRGITADAASSVDAALPPRGITSSSFVPDLKAKAAAVGKLAGQDLLTHVPVLGRVVRRPSFVDYLDAVKTKADPQLDLFNKTPKLGDSPLFSTAADPFTPASLKPEEPAPAPYRLRGNQIQDATTVTPKQIIGPDRQLAAAPDVPAPAPRGITQGKAPYVPGAAMEPAPFLTMHGAESGETAALMQLTHTGGQALRRIAQARGLKIPAAADNISIIQKIHDDLSPEEIQSFGDAAKARAQERAVSLEGVDPAIVSDNRAIAQKLYSKADEMQAAGESPYKIRAWRTAGESIETRPTPVKDILGNVDALKTIRGVDSRMAQHIQEVTGSGQPAPVAAPPVPPTPAGTPPQAAPATAVPQRGITQQQPSPISPEAQIPKITKAMVTENGAQMYRVAYPDGRLSIIPERMLDKIKQGAEAPKPQIATEANTEDLLRQSLQVQKAKAAAVGASPPGLASASSTPPAGGFSVAQKTPSYTIGKGEPLPNAPDVAKHAIFDADGNRAGHLQISVRPDGTGDIGWLGPDDRKGGAPLDIGADSMRGIVNQLREQYPDLTGKVSGKPTYARQQARESRRTAARGITQPIDLNAPPDQRVMPPEVTAEANKGGQTVGLPAPQNPNFKKWFGDSQVRDEKGEPLVVYHGSNKKFDEFKPTESFRNSDSIYGGTTKVTSPSFFFTDDKATAQTFAKDRSLVSERLKKEAPGRPQTQAFYLRADNPLDLTTREGMDDFEYITGYTPDTWEDVQRMLDDKDVVHSIREHGGYDAVKLRESNGANSWAIFDPHQVKSATRNKGTFNPNDPKVINDLRPPRGITASPSFRGITGENFSNA